jgi:hypothetical protein
VGKKKVKGKIIKYNGNSAMVEFEENLNDECFMSYVTIEKPTRLRGKDANSLSWVLIDRIAHKLNVPRDDIYDQMLKKYGVATYIVVKPEKAECILNSLEHGRILGEIIVNGQKGVQIQIFLGSSSYTTKEFYDYMQGIISECESMGLVIPDKDVFAQAALQWGL